MSISFSTATSSECTAIYQGLHSLLKIYGSNYWNTAPALSDITTIMANALAQYEAINGNNLIPVTDNP